ncbi:MAG: sel1 repeat family protein [Chlamydiales bacterium]|jgi:TPR repeat protein|nr:sel1 repeat family protein [Chlamydiales bacterium]
MDVVSVPNRLYDINVFEQFKKGTVVVQEGRMVVPVAKDKHIKLLPDAFFLIVQEQLRSFRGRSLAEVEKLAKRTIDLTKQAIDSTQKADLLGKRLGRVKIQEGDESEATVKKGLRFPHRSAKKEVKKEVETDSEAVLYNLKNQSTMILQILGHQKSPFVAQEEFERYLNNALLNTVQIKDALKALQENIDIYTAKYQKKYGAESQPEMFTFQRIAPTLNASLQVHRAVIEKIPYFATQLSFEGHQGTGNFIQCQELGLSPLHLLRLIKAFYNVETEREFVPKSQRIDQSISRLIDLGNVRLHSLVAFMDAHAYLFLEDFSARDMFPEQILELIKGHLIERERLSRLGHEAVDSLRDQLKFEFLLDLEKKNSSQALYWLGLYHAEGIGTLPDFGKASDCYLEAINYGDLRACRGYGDLLLKTVKLKKLDGTAGLWQALLYYAEAIDLAKDDGQERERALIGARECMKLLHFSRAEREKFEVAPFLALADDRMKQINMNEFDREVASEYYSRALQSCNPESELYSDVVQKARKCLELRHIPEDQQDRLLFSKAATHIEARKLAPLEPLATVERELEEIGKNLQKMPSTAISILRALADEMDDERALVELGHAYLFQYALKNPKLTATDSGDYLRRAAKLGNLEALYQLADYRLRHLNALEASKEGKAIFKTLKELSEKGHPQASVSLGQCWERGVGTEKNVKKAFGCYSQGLEQKDSRAYQAMGDLLLHNESVFSEDPATILEYYRKSMIANQGQKDEYAKAYEGATACMKKFGYTQKQQSVFLIPFSKNHT